MKSVVLSFCALLAAVSRVSAASMTCYDIKRVDRSLLIDYADAVELSHDRKSDTYTVVKFKVERSEDGDEWDYENAEEKVLGKKMNCSIQSSRYQLFFCENFDPYTREREIQDWIGIQTRLKEETFVNNENELRTMRRLEVEKLGVAPFRKRSTLFGGQFAKCKEGDLSYALDILDSGRLLRP